MKEQEPDDEQDGREKREGEFEDVGEEAGGGKFLVVGDGFDHEIGTIADVSVRTEKYRTNTSGRNCQ